MASRQNITDGVIIRKNILQNLTISELFTLSYTDISGIPQDPKLNIFGRFQGWFTMYIEASPRCESKSQAAIEVVPSSQNDPVPREYCGVSSRQS